MHSNLLLNCIFNTLPDISISNDNGAQISAKLKGLKCVTAKQKFDNCFTQKDFKVKGEVEEAVLFFLAFVVAGDFEAI